MSAEGGEPGDAAASAEGGVLSLVATPIGNLEDITLRALRVLREAELVLAEDTRHTLGLMRHYEIQTPLQSFHAHSTDERRIALAQKVADGARLALVSDAGTPGVSDPGAELASEVLARGGRVEALPGASAVLTGLLSSGLRTDQFRFVGFLPRSGSRRGEALDAIARDPLTSVLFESPRRVAATLAELAEVCEPTRRGAVCRELTKLHEEVLRGTLAELAQAMTEQARGEMTVVVAGHDGQSALPQAEAVEALDLDALIRAQLERGAPAKQIAREIARDHGLDRRDVYRRVSELKA